MNQSEMIGSRLKEERLQQKLTLKQLSEKVGLSIGYLSQVERGYGTLSLSALKKLSSALGLEMSAFLITTPRMKMTNCSSAPGSGRNCSFPASLSSILPPSLCPIPRCED